MYKNTVSIMATDKSYAVLFTREKKKPHVIYGKGTGDCYENLLAAASRGVKLVKGDSVIFRTNNERIRKLLHSKVNPTETEVELVDMLRAKAIKVSIRSELDGYNELMVETINKRDNKTSEPVQEVKKSNAPKIPFDDTEISVDSIGAYGNEDDLGTDSF